MPLSRIRHKTKARILNKGKSGKVAFLGYSGASVDLSDHGFDAPVIYDLKSFAVVSQRIPLMYEHQVEVGHTLRIENSGDKVTGKGILSVDNQESQKIRNSAAKGFPWQGSIGLNVDKTEFVFHSKGVRVNNRYFRGPHYVAKNVLMDEMTITALGRDEDTAVHTLSKAELMTIKNSKPKPGSKTRVRPTKDTKAPPQKKEPVKNRKPDTKQPPSKQKNRPSEDDDIEPRKRRVDNRKTQPQLPVKKEKISRGDLFRIQNSFQGERATKIIAHALDRNWSKSQLIKTLKLDRLENKYPEPANLKNSRQAGESQEKFLEGRVFKYLYQGKSEDKEKAIIKRYGEKLGERILNAPTISLKETLVTICKTHGQNFQGHGDTDDMIDYLAHANVRGVSKRVANSSFSTIDMPNFFKKTTQLVMDAAWKVKGTGTAEELCYEVEKSNFNVSERFRPSGGQIWEGLDSAGKIKHASFGQETRYTTTLDTKAQMLMIKREDILSDEFGVIKEQLKLMLEGAAILPDYKLAQRIWQPNGTFFVNGTNDITSSATLTEANLATQYDALSKQVISKGRVSWHQDMEEEWTIIVGTTSMERTAWEIIKQAKFVSNTNSNTKQGADNYWYNRFKIKLWRNLANTTFNSNAQADTWLLYPSSQEHAPFSISWLNGNKKPVVRTYPAPMDMLGFAVVGYIDLDVNDRDNTVIRRMRPTGSIT